MARLWQSGFELNSASIEFTGSASPNIQTSIVRSGSYALRISSLSSGAAKRVQYDFAAANINVFFVRFYVYITTFPSAANKFFTINNSANTINVAKINLNNDKTLALFDEDGQIGSNSPALVANQWYRIEIEFDRSGASGSHILKGRIDGVEFASDTARAMSAGGAKAFWGGNLGNEAQITGDWYFDDIAINDNSGAFQNSYPGSGRIIHRYPKATGDANGFLAQVGGTAGATNNFTRVNEVTPDDATSYNGSALLNAEDLFNCEDSGLVSKDIINVVAVGVRMADLVAADATAAFVLEIEKTTGGTKTQSGTIIPK